MPIDIIAERGKVYGNAYELSGAATSKLFPDGLRLETPDDHIRFHLLRMIVAKLARYANKFKSGGHEDSLVDIAGYAEMLRQYDAREKE